MNSSNKIKSLYKKYKFNIEDFKVLSPIKSGTFGSVFSVENINTNEKMAAKVLTCQNSDPNYKIMVNREIFIMIKCEHPTIIKFRGYSLKDFSNENNTTIFMNLSTRGSLFDLLSRVKKGLGDSEYDNTVRQKILVGIARGMMYLHSHQIIHRDLKPGNILLDNNFEPHITDFGLSKIYEIGKTIEQSHPYGTSIYMAPEVISGNQYSQKADVYSFGILMFEVVTDTSPYPDLESNKITFFQFNEGVVYKNYRPTFDSFVKESIKNLIIRCWDKETKNRPTFEEIFNLLSSNKHDFIYDVFSENAESGDADDEHPYFLDDVDEDELQLYVEDIIMDASFDSVEEMNLKKLNDEMKKEKENLEKRIVDIDKENKEIKEEYIDLVNINTAIQSENDEMKNEISTLKNKLSILLNDNKTLHKEVEFLTNSKIYIDQSIHQDKKEDKGTVKMIKSAPPPPKEKETPVKVDEPKKQPSTSKTDVSKDESIPQNITIKAFNALTIIEQQSILKTISETSSFFSKLFLSSLLSKTYNLINFILNKIIVGSNCIQIHCPDLETKLVNAKNDFELYIMLNLTQKLYYANILDDAQISFLSQFKNITIEMYDDYFIKNILIKMKSYVPQMNIAFLISSGKASTDYKDNNYINQVVVDTDIKVICENACKLWNALTDITFKMPSSLTKIEDQAFSRCELLTKLIIPPSVIEIGSMAFYGCESLKEILIPPSVKYMGYGVFCKCASLKQISIPPSLDAISSSAFKDCTSLEKILIPPSVKVIGDEAFKNCTSLVKLVIPPSVSNIKFTAVEGCASLSELVLPDTWAGSCQTRFGCKYLWGIRVKLYNIKK